MIGEILKRPFEPQDIEWRVQQSGEKNGKCWAMVLAYVTNRAIMDRLDECFDIGGWKNEFLPTPSMDGVMCGISAKIGGEWVTKYDGAENTQVEAVKGGLSSAMKRTGVQFGIGRYLYHLESNFAKVVEKGTPNSKSAKTKSSDNKDIWFYWLPPELPNWALPITNEQLKIIHELIEQKDVDINAMKAHFKYEDLKNITKEDAVTMIQLLSKKKDKANAAKDNSDQA